LLFLFLNGMTGALAPFSYLVKNIVVVFLLDSPVTEKKRFLRLTPGWSGECRQRQSHPGFPELAEVRFLIHSQE
jgi:hypothetical protein